MGGIGKVFGAVLPSSYSFPISLFQILLLKRLIPERRLW